MSHPNVFRLAQDWMWNNAFPFWSDAGTDWKHGGFVESLNLDGSDAQCSFKRTRVTCRQIYCFAQAETLGWPGGKELVVHGLEHLTGPLWLGNKKGFARKVSQNGRVVLDDTPDLYDYAFVLFAFAWAYRVTQQTDLLSWAEATLDCAERLLRDKNGAGFWHDATKEGWRQQNPHMHLLEAALIAYKTFGCQRYADLAKELVALFQTHLFDNQSGILLEFFDTNWNVAPGKDGQFYEPGHQFEWAWILGNCQQILGLDLLPEIGILAERGNKFGLDLQSGLIPTAVTREGQISDNRYRTWPNTERLKSACTLYDLAGVDPMPIFEQSTLALFNYHLAHNPNGTWIDAFDSNLKCASSSIPASSLYHIVLAFSEMLRVEKAIETIQKISS